MISTTSTYNPYVTVRDIDMVVTFPAVSETAAENATYSATDQMSFSDLSQLNNLNYIDTKFATCEDGLVTLDGSFRFMPDVLTTQQIGWWSNELSMSNGEFWTQQKFTATLSEKETVVGFSLYMSKTNKIKQCRVKVFDGQTELFDEIFTATSEEMIIELPVSDFDKIEISDIYTAEPYRRIKMLGFQFGIIKRWNRNNIVSASIQESADYTGNTLPINELKVEFDNSTHEFDLFGSTRQYVYRTATNTATVDAQNANTLAIPSQIRNVDATLFNYATCEDDLVKLDGSYKYYPDTYYDMSSTQIGYFNNALSNSQGQFSATPSVSYNWDKEINISGFKLFFGKTAYATSITITAYNDNTVIDTKTVSNDSPVVDVDFKVSGCDKVTFSFAGVPEQNRFIKLSKIQVLRYVESWGAYLTKRQKVIAEFIVNGEHVSMGDSYVFDSVKQINGGLTAEIIGKSPVSYLDGQKHAGEHGTTALCYQIDAILTDTGIQTSYDPNLMGVVVSKATPKDTTKRAAIHYTAQAGGGTCWFDRNGRLNIKKLDGGNFVDELDATNIYSNDIARMNEYVNMIRLTVKDEYTDPETSNTYYGGSGLYYRELQNNCVYTNNGTDVAEWLLRQYQRRIYFEIQSRGNPALELGDTIRITMPDGTKYIAVIYDQTFEYDGGLKCTIKAVEATGN